MPIPTEITSILPEFGVPAGAIGLAYGLVRGAGAWEKDASEPALKFVSGLLIGGGVTSFGKLGATLIPVIFDRIFGSRPLSIKFILRSFIVTTFFWIILLGIKHAPFDNTYFDIFIAPMGMLIVPAWYVVDWVSLIKARVLLRLIKHEYTIVTIALFFILDISISYLLPLLFIVIPFVLIGLLFEILPDQQHNVPLQTTQVHEMFWT